jgi:DNA N-6-adenine-methyltransferase (Dam)
MTSLDTLAGAEAAFKAAAARLEDNTATPDVVSRVEKIIVKATRQHAGWGKLTIDALLVLGLYLLRNPYRGMGKGGRPPKTVRADSLPTLAERGVGNRRIAWRALAVARISEADRNAYLASGGTSERGLHEFVKRRELERDENYSETKTGNVVPFANASNGDSRGHPWWFPSARGKKHLALQATTASVEWYTPPEVFRALNCRFDLDVASPGADVVPWIPADRHFTLADNGLEQDWGDAFVFMNAPYGRGKLPLWTEKFREHGNGICLVVDRTSTQWWQDLCSNADLILQVNKKIDFVRPGGDGTGTNALGSSLVAYGKRGVQALLNAAAAGLGTLFIPCQNSVLIFEEFEHETHLLRGKLVVSQALARYNPEEIADLLVTADREKAGEVWRALLDRLASSMSILFFSGHCTANPR